jgi:DNA-directed RNA polymerase sigma subunit (sigma70/sigma32)
MVLALGATLQRYRNKQLLQWIREIRLTARAVRTLRARFGADVQDEDRPSDEELGPDSMDEAEPEDGVGDGENRLL